MATIQQTQNFPPNFDGTAIAVPPPPVAPPGRNPYARRAAAPSLPIPPTPVMPPEGIAPVTDPASTGTAPDASPTTMVLAYLKSRGYTPSSENVRRALEANQRDPGVIPGLRSDRPATDAEDQAAMRAAGVGSGRGGGGGQGGGGLVREEGSWDVEGKGGQPNTSAAPSSWRGPFSGPPDPTNTLTTTADQAMRFAQPDQFSRSNLPMPEYGSTSDYVRPPLPPAPPAQPIVPNVTGALPADVGLDSSGAPRIGGPPPQLALPPPVEPAMAQPGVPIPQPAPAPTPAPMPEVPNVVGQAARPPITTSTTLRGPGSSATPPGPKIAPGPRIQGAPIQPGPYMGPVGRTVTGGITGAGQGYRMGGPYGAAAGGLAGAAPGVKELVDAILAR